ncbi:MAG: hypothetical protein Q9198_000428, partial [Flavoplaca austrocitrina]
MDRDWRRITAWSKTGQPDSCARKGQISHWDRFRPLFLVVTTRSNKGRWLGWRESE